MCSLAPLTSVLTGRIFHAAGGIVDKDAGGILDKAAGGILDKDVGGGDWGDLGGISDDAGGILGVVELPLSAINLNFACQ